jgi:hypothetical protein
MYAGAQTGKLNGETAWAGANFENQIPSVDEELEIVTVDLVRDPGRRIRVMPVPLKFAEAIIVSRDIFTVILPSHR